MAGRGSSSIVNSNSDTSCLIEGVEENYRPLKIASALCSQLLLMISLVCGGFILPVFYKNEELHSTDTFSAVIYLQIIVWVAITILTWYIKAEHKRSRTFGYHDFYDSTRHLHRVAFYMLCGGNLLLLVVANVTHNFCLGGGISPCSLNISLTPVNYLQIILILEVILSVPFLIKHMVEVLRFNQKKSPPDVLQGQISHQWGQDEVIIGIRGRNYIERLLNHQADQLMTLNQRNEMLQQQIYALTQLHLSSQSTQNE